VAVFDVSFYSFFLINLISEFKDSLLEGFHFLFRATLSIQQR
jgi:hypothetical protein